MVDVDERPVFIIVKTLLFLKVFEPLCGRVFAPLTWADPQVNPTAIVDPAGQFMWSQRCLSALPQNSPDTYRDALFAYT
ncbi:hypothetical protein VTO73DRAFT_6499 [Trametes versicolor]